MEAMKPTIKIGDVCPNRPVKLVDILSDGVILGMGENFTTELRMSFADCETIWGV